MGNLTPLLTRTEFKTKYYPSNDYSFINDKFNPTKPNNLQLMPPSTNRKINAEFEGKYYPSNDYSFISDKFKNPNKPAVNAAINRKIEKLTSSSRESIIHPMIILSSMINST